MKPLLERLQFSSIYLPYLKRLFCGSTLKESREQLVQFVREHANRGVRHFAGFIGNDFTYTLAFSIGAGSSLSQAAVNTRRGKRPGYILSERLFGGSGGGRRRCPVLSGRQVESTRHGKRRIIFYCQPRSCPFSSESFPQAS